jgi:transcriptional regulator of acetoin/glycerol metabolism
MNRNFVPDSHRNGGAGKSIASAWEHFLAGDGISGDAVRRLIEDSWRRCLDKGVDPALRSAPLAVDGDGLHSLQRGQAELIEAARPVMEQAREFLTESGTVMVLTDPAGVVLWMEGDAGAKDNGQGIKLVPGALWGESFSGTNAIGTALMAGTPVQICAEEHFVEEIKRWTCSASVIRDPFDGRTLGVLDISGLSGAHNTHCLALAVAGAGRIESRLAALEMEKRARLLDLTTSQSSRWANSGLVVFDRRGRLVRANEDAGVYMNCMGLDLKAFDALDIDATLTGGHSQAAKLPHWLQRDWLEPVIERNERLGTVLSIPVPIRRTVQAPKVTPAPLAGSGRQAGGPFEEIIGASAALTQVKGRAFQLAKLNVPVLLLGPTGAGKEVFAQAIHKASGNAGGPFVPLNCGSMTRDLLASELFGYVEGAFTGARRGGMIGKFEAADGGTLFLDEIGEMPLELQPHLLRVLEEGEVYRLGENKPRKVNVRLIAATNRDLRAEVSAGNFRMDLFYRLAVTILRLPSLSEHKDDIPLLVRHFIDQAARRYGVPPRQPPADVMATLAAHSWPGNVRELRNVVESMLLLAQDDGLSLADIPYDLMSEPLSGPGPGPGLAAVGPVSAFPRAAGKLADSERDAIIVAIRAEGGNFTRTAERLGIAKSTLYEKMKRYGIDRQSLDGSIAH